MFSKKEEMKSLFRILFIVLSFLISITAQSFDVKAERAQTFSFKDTTGRSQASFHSSTPFEDIDGLTTQISGTVTFDVKNFAGTLKGKITIPVASLKTGIEKMERDLRSSAWLDAAKYPEITFSIKKVENVQKIAPNKINADVVGDFYLHGVTKEVTAKATVTYLDQSPQTLKVEPGDLLGVIASFDIKLSDFGVEHMLLGTRVSNDINIKVNLVGTNKF